MKKEILRMFVLLGAAVAITSNAFAAPNVTNATQKGSLLVWPDIRVDSDGVEGTWDTLIRLQNDGSSDVDVLCYWMDGNKNKVDFIVPVTKNQAVWFNAWTGNGTHQINRFPQAASNGFDNPFLIAPGFTTEAADGGDHYDRGLLACWAVDGGAQNQVKWNHLSGTATVYNANIGIYEYNAYAFFVPTGIDLQPIGAAGSLELNGVQYDSCPLYQIGQFTPVNVDLPANQLPTSEPLTNLAGNAFSVWGNRLAVVGCSLNLNQDWSPVFTKLEFDVWNEDEVKFTGAFECSDSWHETVFADPSLFPPPTTTDAASLAHGPIDSGAQNFQFSVLATYNARYRVQGVKSTQCEDSTLKPPRVTQAVGIIAVQSTLASVNAANPPRDMAGTTLAAAGKFSGRIVWDPESAVPEGGIR